MNERDAVEAGPVDLPTSDADLVKTLREAEELWRDLHRCAGSPDLMQALSDGVSISAYSGHVRSISYDAREQIAGALRRCVAKAVADAEDRAASAFAGARAAALARLRQPIPGFDTEDA